MAPNIAGRLSAAAGRDEILVSEDCLGPDLHHFDAGPRRAVDIDSRGTRVPARPVLGRGQAISSFEARARRRLQPFIGRQAELRQLDHVLGQALAGAALAPGHRGATGRGQDAAGARIPAARRAQGLPRAAGPRCRAGRRGAAAAADADAARALGLGADAPRQAAREALAALLAELGRDDLALPLSPLLGLAADGGASPACAPALPALASLFEALAARQPLVLFVDDWHWADASTRQLLSALGRDTPGLPLLVLATARAIDEATPNCRGCRCWTWRRSRLPRPPTRCSTCCRSADPFIAAEICLYSGGNPLYVEELCHSASMDDPERWLVRRLGGGNWLNVLVESRVARLPPDQADLVRLAAVVGPVIAPGLLVQLSGRAADDPALLALADEDLLFADADGGHRFKHGLTRDVIYESVGLHLRRALHLRVAQALLARSGGTSDLPHEALAYHYQGADRPADAAHHAEAAGDRAAASSVLDRARVPVPPGADRTRPRRPAGTGHHALAGHQRPAGPGQRVRRRAGRPAGVRTRRGTRAGAGPAAAGGACRTFPGLRAVRAG
jgi:hypothetical protein